MSAFADRRKKMTDALYDEVRMQHPDLFEQCVAAGVVVRDAIDNRSPQPDSLEIAAMVEAQAVSLVASALGIRVQLPVEGNPNV